MTSRAFPKLNQSRRSSSSISPHLDEVTVTNANKQFFAAQSENSNSRLLPKQKPNDVPRTSTTNEGPETMQQSCNTNDGQKAMFLQLATKKRPEQTFSDVFSSKGPQAAHAVGPVTRTGFPLYQRKTAVSALRKQQLCTMSPHSNLETCNWRALCPPEAKTELSAFP